MAVTLEDLPSNDRIARLLETLSAIYLTFHMYRSYRPKSLQVEEK